MRALNALAFGELARFPGAIRHMHLGIAQRAFRGVGEAARPVQLIHDAIARRAAAAALATLPETSMFAALLRRRSAGIRDLRHGSLVDEDWRGRDPEALRAAACKEVPLLEGATHCFISASVTAEERHPLGRLVGDTLVLVPSASGRGRTRRIPFKAEHGHHVGSTHHLALLNHPEVYARLLEWLASPAGGN